ncbi:MAG: flagellar biosynthesis protein FlhB [Rickettsiaceae bacterium]|nr:flagellar biosynthesis protein FlhB [Rickettsiaceae bacterium]
MSEELEDKESKTEQPSERRIEESYEKGQVAYSKEVTSFAMLFALSVISIFLMPYIIPKMGFHLKLLLEHSGDLLLTPEGSGQVIIDYINRSIFLSFPAFLLIIVVIIAANFMQHGRFILAPDQIMPKLKRISLLEGFNRIFSRKSFAEFIKGILKISITAAIIYYVVMDDVKIMQLYTHMKIPNILEEFFKVIKDILVSITLFMCMIGAADFFYQKYEHMQNLMMTRQELKEEYKQAEGSPEIKKKQRELMKKASKGRMLQNVPKADVVITNPEHYSVALSYDPETMKAPKLVAKGLDLIAFKIREIAKEHDIPVVENPPLARTLYLLDIDQQIAPEQYETVAEIISYVYGIKKRTNNH